MDVAFTPLTVINQYLARRYAQSAKSSQGLKIEPSRPILWMAEDTATTRWAVVHFVLRNPSNLPAHAGPASQIVVHLLVAAPKSTNTVARWKSFPCLSF